MARLLQACASSLALCLVSCHLRSLDNTILINKSMNKPFKHEYTKIEWEYNDEHFDAWCKGQTGFPIGKKNIKKCHPHSPSPISNFKSSG